MTDKERKTIKQAIENIERWSGEAYQSPESEHPQCPDGDDIYMAVESLKGLLGQRELDLKEMIIDNFILFATHKNNEEGHELYDTLASYMVEDHVNELHGELK